LASIVFPVPGGPGNHWTAVSNLETMFVMTLAIKCTNTYFWILYI
jgi:hypothetical protein